MNQFIDRLERLNQQDTRVRAVLRRSLAFEPGGYPAAFPYVERHMSESVGEWQRKVHYLVAGLWAQHWRVDRPGPVRTLASACAALDREKKGSEDSGGLSGTERRFVALLDADEDQLPHRLRQMAALLTDYAIDFSKLLSDVSQWRAPEKYIQNKWAREFYRAPGDLNNVESQIVNEEKKP